MSENAARALAQIGIVAKLLDFVSHPALNLARDQIPTNVPASLGALGFDEPVWAGLGMVGLWAALDVFAERSGLKAARKPLPDCLKLTGKLSSHDVKVTGEIEDLRNLFAHNFAGHADLVYFKFKKRYALQQGSAMELSSKATFDGECVSLNAAHLHYYAEAASAIVKLFD